MIIAHSLRRKAIVTAVAFAGFVLLYEATIHDSQHAARVAAAREATALPSPGVRLAFNATAYCQGATTASGVTPRNGIAAADPRLLPVGSVVEVDSTETRYNGIYTIMDTGPNVQGRRLDLYMWKCDEALRFGLKPVHLIVLRLGWDPRATKAAPSQ